MNNYGVASRRFHHSSFFILHYALLIALHTYVERMVWPVPRSLATTCGISVDFFSSPYLDVSVRAVPLIPLWIQDMMTGLYSCRIAPFRHPRLIAYLQLPAAYRSLSRLSSAPSAKASALRPSSLDQLEAGHTPRSGPFPLPGPVSRDNVLAPI